MSIIVTVVYQVLVYFVFLFKLPSFLSTLQMAATFLRSDLTTETSGLFTNVNNYIPDKECHIPYLGYVLL
jgi:hypothetical protein